MREENSYLVEDCSMRELVIIAALVSALHAASLHKDSDVGYKCQADHDKNATLAAERFINERHRHGYKFKFVSLDSRSAEKKVSFHDSLFLWLRLLLVYFNNIMNEKKISMMCKLSCFCAD